MELWRCGCNLRKTLFHGRGILYGIFSVNTHFMNWTVKCRWRLTVYNAYFQFKMLLSLLSSLLDKTKYSLTRIRRIFPAENNPKDGVPALVALYELALESARQLQSEFPPVFSVLLQARLFASNLTTEPVCDLLASYLQVLYTHVLRLKR